MRPRPASSRIIIASLLLIGCLLGQVQGQVDANTLLSLSLESTLNGAQGETPLSASGVSFEPGVSGNAAFFANGNMVTFASGGNIDSLTGTLEFFIRPRWNGNDGLNHNFLSWGVAVG